MTFYKLTKNIFKKVCFVEDEVEDYDETLYVTRSKDRSAVAVISQEKLKWLERTTEAPIGSLDQAVTRDKLIELGVLPDDSQNVYADNE